jgi:hypothetical protein
LRLLRNGLQLKWWLTLCRKLLIHLVDDFLKLGHVHVTTELRMYGAWMHSCGAHPTVSMTFVKSDVEEDVCRLRSAIRDKGLIGRPLKIGILEIDIGKAVTRGSQVNQPSFLADERGNPIDENKVAQVISAAQERAW